MPVPAAGSRWRGHLIHETGRGYVYSDTGRAVASDPQRPCGACGLENTSAGHDGCLGELPGVVNACCGHGAGAAWVVFDDGHRLTVTAGPT